MRSVAKQKSVKTTTLKLLILVCATVLLSACAREAGKLAKVDGELISASDLDRTAGKELFNQRESLYKLENQKLSEYIGALLLTREATKRGVSVATLLDQEVNSKLLAVTDGEVDAFYNQNKSRIPVEVTKVREQIREHLRNQKLEAQRTIYFKSLREKAEIVTYLKRPPVYRADVSVAGAPAKGPETAQITIVKFEDFQCPFCKQAQPAFTDILNRYNGKVRLVHKDLPLDSIHPAARQASEAARCAHDQGKFWVLHDKLYEHAPKHTIDDLRLYAKQVGLNQSSFEQCLSSGKYRAAVQKDVSEGAQLGITGTPTFFINGRELSGAQSVEAIAQIIDEELARAN
jgi:protein-disulfide isomerase